MSIWLVCLVYCDRGRTRCEIIDHYCPRICYTIIVFCVLVSIRLAKHTFYYHRLVYFIYHLSLPSHSIALSTPNLHGHSLLVRLQSSSYATSSLLRAAIWYTSVGALIRKLLIYSGGFIDLTSVRRVIATLTYRNGHLDTTRSLSCLSGTRADTRSSTLYIIERDRGITKSDRHPPSPKYKK